MRQGRSSNTPLNDYDPDPEWSLRARLKEKCETQRHEMDERDEALDALQRTIAEMTTRMQGLTQREAERMEADRQAEAERARFPP